MENCTTALATISQQNQKLTWNTNIQKRLNRDRKDPQRCGKRKPISEACEPKHDAGEWAEKKKKKTRKKAHSSPLV